MLKKIIKEKYSFVCNEIKKNNSSIYSQKRNFEMSKKIKLQQHKNVFRLHRNNENNNNKRWIKNVVILSIFLYCFLAESRDIVAGFKLGVFLWRCSDVIVTFNVFKYRFMQVKTHKLWMLSKTLKIEVLPIW